LNTLPAEPLLHLALYAGLASLKLPACYDQSTKNVDCPVCDGDVGSDSQGLGLGKLGEEVPLSHHANSTIVCRISGKIMDEDNMPMAFPDGHVYSREVSLHILLIILADLHCRLWKKWLRRMEEWLHVHELAQLVHFHL
jgi:hypothetical protein